MSTDREQNKAAEFTAKWFKKNRNKRLQNEKHAIDAQRRCKDNPVVVEDCCAQHGHIKKKMEKETGRTYPVPPMPS